MKKLIVPRYIFGIVIKRMAHIKLFVFFTMYSIFSIIFGTLGISHLCNYKKLGWVISTLQFSSGCRVRLWYVDNLGRNQTHTSVMVQKPCEFVDYSLPIDMCERHLAPSLATKLESRTLVLSWDASIGLFISGFAVLLLQSWILCHIHIVSKLAFVKIEKNTTVM